MEFHPVTPERLADLERFSGRHGRFRYHFWARGPLPSGMGMNGRCTPRIHVLESVGTAALTWPLSDATPYSRRGHRRQALTQWGATYVA
jgi:hypothetical protein